MGWLIAIVIWSVLGCGGAPTNARTDEASASEGADSTQPESEPATASESRTETETETDPAPAVAPVADAQPPPPPAAPPPAVAGTAPPPPYVLVELQTLTDTQSVLGRYRRLLAEIRDEVALPPGGRAPVACGSTIREDVAEMVRAGYSVTSSIGSYRRELDELCDGFERWESPDEALLGRIRRFHNRLDRIEGWMKDIRTCIDPGPYDHRCENAYGPAGGRDAQDALEAMRVLDQVRQVVDGVPDRSRFPCRHPIWARIEARRWTQSVARAQMPHIPGEARRLCEQIGVDETELEELVQRIRDHVDQHDASAAQREIQTNARLEQLRAQYALPD